MSKLQQDILCVLLERLLELELIRQADYLKILPVIRASDHFPEFFKQMEEPADGCPKD